MMAAGQAPDIFYTNYVMRDQFAAEGHLLDLRRVSVGDSLVARLWPHVIETGLSVDSGWYSVGNWEFTAGVYYNKDSLTGHTSRILTPAGRGRIWYALHRN